MPQMIDILLLLGLPASGKSEIRTYLQELPAAGRRDLRLGELVHLDDSPYLREMRLISRALRERQADPVFFATDAEPFLEPGDWLTLTALLDEDYTALDLPRPVPERPGEAMLDRFDRARAKAGLNPAFASLPPELRSKAAEAIEQAATAHARSLTAASPAGERTVLIELARGARPGMRPPLPPPWGYARALAAFSPRMLERAAALYVWVTPIESRRRNLERAAPTGDGSILEHRVPERVLRAAYAGDDFAWLLDHADRSGHLTLVAHGRRFQIPAVRFDNRVDHTSFLRQPGAARPAEAVTDLHRRLAASLGSLALQRRAER